MSIEFSSKLLPVSGTSELFGFVQSAHIPSAHENVNEQIPRCNKCKSPKFPLKDSTFSCPICNPSDDFLESSIRFDEGFEDTNLLFLVFDVSFPIEKIRNMISDFANSMHDNNRAVIIAAAENEQIIVYSCNSVPYFFQIQETETFIPDGEYEVTKEDILDIIIPSLESLYGSLLFCFDNDYAVDLVKPLQLILYQQKGDKRPFGIFFMIYGQSKPLTMIKADLIGKTIASKLGIVHFGASEGFKKLMAIARHSFGCVFGLSLLNPLTFSRLIKLSKPTILNLYFPRFIEVEKVTSCKGDMKMTSLITLLSMTNACGCSAKLSIDYSRISKLYQENVNILEYLDCVDGRYLTLHRFKWAETPQIYESSLNILVNQAITLKEFSSNVLRGICDEESETYINHIIKSNVVNIPNSCLSDVGERPERDSLKLYFVLHSFLSDYKNKLIKLADDNGYLYVYQPMILAYVKTDIINEVNNIINSDWPFEIQMFKDMDTFRYVVERYGGKFE